MGGLLNAIAQGPQPVQIDNPLQRAAKVASVQNLQGEAQERQISIQQRQREMASQDAIAKSWASAGGDLDKTVEIAQQQPGVLPEHLVALQKHALDVKTARQKLDTDQLETDIKHADRFLGHANGLLQLPEDQAAQAWTPLITRAIQTGDVKLEDLKAQGLNPMQYPGHAAVQNLVLGANGLKAATAQALAERKAKAEEATAAAAGVTAGARAQSAASTAAKTQAELPGIALTQKATELKNAETQRTQDAQMLSSAAAQGPGAFQAALGQLPYERARIFAGVTKPEDIQRIALTPDQAITTAATQAQRDEQARHNIVEEKQGAGRLGVEQGRLAMEKQMSGIAAPGQISPAAQMAADGRMDPQTLRAQLRKNPGLISQIQKLDPGFDEANIDKRYNTLKEFTSSSNSKAGGQVLALNTMIHHADLFLDTAEALKNGSFVPGNKVYNAVASAFGSAPPTQANLVAQFLAGEAGKVAKGGIPAEGEINGILKNMGSSSSPDQIKGAANSLLQLAAGRMIPLAEKAKEAKIDNVVSVIGPDAKAILQKRGLNPDTLKPVAAQAGPVTPASQAEYDALPKGAQFKKPNDPKIYVKQ